MASLDERVDIDLDTRIAALPKPKRGLTALRARQIPWKPLKTIRLAQKFIACEAEV